MSQGAGTLYDLTDQLRQQSPEHLDLFASLSDDEFQIAFDSLLGKALAGLEESKKGFQSLDEPALSAVLRLAMLVVIKRCSNIHNFLLKTSANLELKALN